MNDSVEASLLLCANALSHHLWYIQWVSAMLSLKCRTLMMPQEALLLGRPSRCLTVQSALTSTAWRTATSPARVGTACAGMLRGRLS